MTDLRDPAISEPGAAALEALWWETQTKAGSFPPDFAEQWRRLAHTLQPIIEQHRITEQLRAGGAELPVHHCVACGVELDEAGHCDWCSGPDPAEREHS